MIVDQGLWEGQTCAAQGKHKHMFIMINIRPGIKLLLLCDFSKKWYTRNWNITLFFWVGGWVLNLKGGNVNVKRTQAVNSFGPVIV